jgi:hypothetical protein
MDAFESIVATLLEAEGFWVRRSVRVNLDIERKLKPSAPRTEVDLVAYRPAKNELWIIECKSWLDSQGVKAAALTDSNHKGAKRFKLFHDDEYLNSVSDALIEQFQMKGMGPRVRLCLVAGKIAGSSEPDLATHFQKRSWEFKGPEWVRKGLIELAEGPYENDVATIAAKILSGDME